MKNKYTGVLLALAALLMAPMAASQQFGFVQPSFFGNIALSQSVGSAVDRHLGSYYDDEDDAFDGRGLSQPTAPMTNLAPDGSNEPLTIRRVSSGALASVHEELAMAMAPEETARMQILHALRSGEVASQFAAQLRHNHLDPTDLADALTAYTVIMWLIVNDRLDGQSDPARLKAVADQLGPLFRSAPELRALSPEQRAVEYERVAALSMYGIAAYFRYDQEDDRKAKAQLQAAVRESMHRTGWDLTAYDITHRGFEPRR